MMTIPSISFKRAEKYLKPVFCVPTGIILAICFSPIPAWSRTPPLSPLDIEATSTTASIDAHNVPLADILRALGDQAGFEVITQEPGPTRSLSLKQVPLVDALEQLLLGTNFVIDYAKSTENEPSTARKIDTIYLLPEVSPEIAEQERAAREVNQTHAAAQNIPDPTDDEMEDSTSPPFSSEASVQDPNSPEETVSSDSQGTRSLAASQALQQQLNPLEEVSTVTPSQESAVSSGYQVPLELQQRALERLRGLSDQLETGRQQLIN